MIAAPFPLGRDQGVAMAFALERERRRIADELHDTAVQQLVLARILIDRACEAGPDDQLDRVRWLLDDALEQLRSLVLGLAPAVLHQNGLCSAIEWLCEQLGIRWRLDYRYRLVGDPVTLPDALTETLFQGARELMTNVGRHARAGSCDVVLTFGDDSAELAVRDDGIGINPKRASGGIHGVSGGFGLLSLHSRIEQLGGELQLGPRDGGGSEAILRLPLPKPAPGGR